MLVELQILQYEAKKEHTLQVASWQGGAFQLESDGKMAKPDMCEMEAWIQLANSRKVEMCRLVENSSRYNFSNACMHGLLSVRMHALLWDWLT